MAHSDFDEHPRERSTMVDIEGELKMLPNVMHAPAADQLGKKVMPFDLNEPISDHKTNAIPPEGQNLLPQGEESASQRQLELAAARKGKRPVVADEEEEAHHDETMDIAENMPRLQHEMSHQDAEQQRSQPWSIRQIVEVFLKSGNSKSGIGGSQGGGASTPTNVEPNKQVLDSASLGGSPLEHPISRVKVPLNAEVAH